jgi:hypothetical protein
MKGFLNMMDHLQTADNVAQSYSQGFCNSQQRINRNGSFCPFHLADIYWMKVGLFSQFFLAESGLLTVQSNILTNQSAMFWAAGHSPLPKQKNIRGSHKLPALDYLFSNYACVEAGETFKNVPRTPELPQKPPA